MGEVGLAHVSWLRVSWLNMIVALGPLRPPLPTPAPECAECDIREASGCAPLKVANRVTRLPNALSFSSKENDRSPNSLQGIGQPVRPWTILAIAKRIGRIEASAVRSLNPRAAAGALTCDFGGRSYILSNCWSVMGFVGQSGPPLKAQKIQFTEPAATCKPIPKIIRPVGLPFPDGMPFRPDPPANCGCRATGQMVFVINGILDGV